MKKHFLFIAFSICCSIIRLPAISQQKPNRCYTMESLNQYFRMHPEAGVQAEQNKNRFAPAQARSTRRTQGILTIPVVFHIVGNASWQAKVTDADVLWQLNKLNEDFSGANADSTNATAFYPIRAKKGYSQIRFCLAQRTPANTLTNGIDRVVSSLTDAQNCEDVNNNGNATLIKHSSSGGADAWDPDRYFNIWVGDFGPCLLGIATFPTASLPNEQGVVVDFSGFSNNPAYTLPQYSLGRTVVHETGHYLGLYHIWDNSGCNNSDFRQLPGSCLLPAGLAGGINDQTVGDTPNQDTETTNCPSGIVTDACSADAPGKNYQNFMDYTEDACYSMFTVKQIDRMQWVLENCRASLLTSNACQPLNLSPNDLSVFAISLPLSNFATCDSAVPLTVTLQNVGSNTITNAVIQVKRNNTLIQTLQWTGNLASLAVINISLNAVALATGVNTIEVCTSLPNGVADSDPVNDCKSVTGTRSTVVSIPLQEGFEGNTFPPAGWLINNPDNGITWQRHTNGLSRSGVAKAFLDHRNYSGSGQADDLTSPSVLVGTADSLWVSFWGSYRGFTGKPFDILQVELSTNCGVSFLPIFTVSNESAFVAPAGAPVVQNTTYTPSSQDQWVRKSIDISPYINSGNVQIRFKAINKNGNNFYLDDIALEKKIFPQIDAGIIEIRHPESRLCTNSAVPEVLIKNYGKQPLTSVKINYQLDGTGPVASISWSGTLSRNQTASVQLPAANFGNLGFHSIRIYTSEPNGTTDQDASNDSLEKSVQILPVLTLNGSLSEEFSGSLFPPANWNVYNPDGDMTWSRHATVGKKNPGSAWFNDYNNNTVDRTDDLALPNLRYSGIDSVFMTFQLASITRALPGASGVRLDTLSVLLSKDCGNTYTTIYKKFGDDLQTVSNATADMHLNEFFPQSSQWRRDSLNLGNWLGSSESLFQLAFRFHGNFENNFFLDDVLVRTEILPERLKNDGYLVLPNPFRNSFTVWHYLPPVNLRYINVYNASGRRVWSRQYSGNADKIIDIDLSSHAAGIYIVNLGYGSPHFIRTIKVLKF